MRIKTMKLEMFRTEVHMFYGIPSEYTGWVDSCVKKFHLISKPGEESRFKKRIQAWKNDAFSAGNAAGSIKRSSFTGKNGVMHRFLAINKESLKLGLDQEGILVHELIHTIDAICESLGIDDHETRAYMGEYLFVGFRDILKEEEGK